MLVQWPVEQIGDECRVVTCGPNRMTPSNHYCPSYYWYKESSLLVCLFWWYIWRSMRLQTQWASFGLFFEAGLPYNPPFHKLHFKITHLSFTMMQCPKVQNLWDLNKWEMWNAICCASFQFIVSQLQIQLCDTESEHCQHFFFANWLNVKLHQ